MRWNRPGLTVDLLIEDSAPVRIRGLSSTGGSGVPLIESGVPLVEMDCAGEGRIGHSSGAQHRLYAAGQALRYADHAEEPAALVVLQRDESRGLEVRTRLRQVGGLPVLQVVNEVANTGSETVVLTYVSSLSLTGFGSELDDLRVHEARNAWAAELRWQCLTAEQAGLVDIGAHGGTSRARHAVTAPGSWSTGDFLPMGGIENVATGMTWVWQIEHHGGWHWEVGDLDRGLYLAASGPTDHEHQWRQPLAPGERFTTVPVAIAVTPGDLTAGLRVLTEYRRAIRRPSADNERLPVIFNDYMNCLMGDPTEEKLAPLVDAAAEVGAEYFVIDAGWYADDGGWWDTVGEWEPSAVRFPNGLGATLWRIRDAGMVPGLWLEPEVIGVRSPLVEKLPADAFFTDGGRPRQENGRFHLDYRSTEVRRRMDAVVDRLVNEYGVGYVKLDYNIDVFPGAGLLGHNRAYLSWLDGVLDRHPGLVLENCASGGMRMDYALLSRLSLQSTSDQTDPFRYAAIAAAAPSAVTPEQGAVWAYPQPGHSPEEASFCLVNALLGRVHLSGRIDLMNGGQRARVRAALDVYKQHRPLLASGRPQWPLGLPGWYDEWLALAIDGGEQSLLAVWYRGTGPGDITLPRTGRRADVLFPTDLPSDLTRSGDTLRLALPGGPAARLIRLS
jgi:alpha-galactosidase